MKESHFLFWFLVSFLSVVLALENPTPTIDWQKSSPNNAHQKNSSNNVWFKYPSGHWEESSSIAVTQLYLYPTNLPWLDQNDSFYLLTYLVGYYLLGRFSSMMGHFAFLGYFGHLAMVTVSIGLVIAGLNLGALAHKIGGSLTVKSFNGLALNQAMIRCYVCQQQPEYWYIQTLNTINLFLVPIYTLGVF
ncbi:hypothetical protein DSO57_1033511 [Entomophthora muscae]|uniref:Uncharacterized protein n=1 Tax=Entomophthora muscae TaxID=34485 RepID=A0ACC2TYN8_9FUNG|nr:hypothetical protein DSO57_1033511 [Entomophthora muscae]